MTRRVRVFIGDRLWVNVPVWSLPFLAAVFGAAQGAGREIAHAVLS